MSGNIDRLGFGGTTLSWHTPIARQRRPEWPSHGTPIPTSSLIDWLEARQEFPAVRAGDTAWFMAWRTTEPERVTPDVIDELSRATPYAPDHLPGEIELIEAFRERHPDLPQVACFDTAFHRAHAARRQASCRFRGAMRRRASSGTAFTACRMPT